MCYSVVSNRTNPMAVLFVVDQAGAMCGRMPRTGNSKADQVAAAINKMFAPLIAMAKKQGGVRGYDEVGATGHGRKGVHNVLQGPLSSQILKLISKISDNLGASYANPIE